MTVTSPLSHLLVAREILSSMASTLQRVSIRKAVPADASRLAALERQIYREERWFVGDRAPSEAALTQRLRSLDDRMSLWLVAESANRLSGWLELHRLPPARLRHVATLTLAVSPRERRQGIASLLLEQSYRWARAVGVRKVSLNVRAGNEAAIHLYERQGFRLEGRERDQIRTDDGFEDNLVMALFLDS